MMEYHLKTICKNAYKVYSMLLNELTDRLSLYFSEEQRMFLTIPVL